MEKRTIGILFGGASSEHDVSLMSATSVLENIDREKYDVIMVGITRDGLSLIHISWGWASGHEDRAPYQDGQQYPSCQG